MSMLEARGTSKAFGSLIAVNNISLSVAPGELRAIIGPNGAGKTTFFNLLTGFFPPTSGAIILDGQDITRKTATQRVKLGMGLYVPDHRDLSGADGARECSHRGGGSVRLQPAYVDQSP